MFDPGRSPGSFYYGGTAGFFALMFRRYVDHVAKVRVVIERMMAASVIEEQLELYFHGLRPRLLTGRFLGMVGTRGVLALLGVPAAQRELVAGRPGGVVAYLRACLDHVVAVALLRENYFWSVYIRGRYTRDACPEYLKAEQFARLQAGLADNVRVATGTVTGCLAGETEPFTAFVLLDHMDWMVRRPELLHDEWRRIFAAGGTRRPRDLQERRARRHVPAGRDPGAPGVRHRTRGAPAPAATAWAPTARSTSRVSSPEAAAATRFGLAALDRFYRWQAPHLRLDAAVLPLRAGAKRSWPWTRGPATSCSTSDAGPAGAPPASRPRERA